MNVPTGVLLVVCLVYAVKHKGADGVGICLGLAVGVNGADGWIGQLVTELTHTVVSVLADLVDGLPI